MCSYMVNLTKMTVDDTCRISPQYLSFDISNSRIKHIKNAQRFNTVMVSLSSEGIKNYRIKVIYSTLVSNSFMQNRMSNDIVLQ